MLITAIIIYTLSEGIPAMISGLFGGGGSNNSPTMSAIKAAAMLGVAKTAAASSDIKKGIDSLLKRDEEKAGEGGKGGAGKGQGGGSEQGGQSTSSGADDKSFKMGGGEGGSGEGGSGEGGGGEDMASIITGGAVGGSNSNKDGFAKNAAKMLGGDAKLLGAGGKMMGAFVKKAGSKALSAVDTLFGKGKDGPVGAARGLTLIAGNLVAGAAKTVGLAAKTAGFGLATTSRLGSAAINRIKNGEGNFVPTSSSFGVAEGASKIASGISKVASKVANSEFGKNFSEGANKAEQRLNSPLHKANENSKQ